MPAARAPPAGADTIRRGGLVNDVVRAEGGRDPAFDRVGHDHLAGGSGADRLHGGWGRDLLAGGADVLVVGQETGPRTGRGAGGEARLGGGRGRGADAGRIADFELGLGRLDLRGGVTVLAAATGNLDANGQLDATLALSTGGRVEVMDVSGILSDR